MIKKLLATLAFLLLASTADATTWWLRPSGGTTGNCTTARGTTDPGAYLRTFADLNACVSPAAFVGGDTVMLKAGTYTEFSGHTAGYTIPSGSVGFPTTLRAVGTEVVTFTGAGGAANAAFYFYGKSYISLIGDDQAKNFRIDMSTAFCLSAIQMANASDHIVMRGLDIGHCNDGNGLSMFFGSGFNTLSYSRLHHHGGPQVGTEQSHAIYLDTTFNTLENLEIDNNTGYGVHCNDAGLATDNVFKNLNIHHNGTTSAAGLLVCSGPRNVYYNMTIWNNTASNGSGIQIDGGSGAVLNSITLHNNSSKEIFMRSPVSGTLFKNLVISNSIGSTLIVDQGSGNTFTTTYCSGVATGCAAVGDPLFMDSGNGDFRPQATSLIKTGGTTLGGVYAIDLFDVKRPQGATYARGCCEYVAPVSPSELVGQWSGDNVITDTSGKNNHATLTGGATYIAGKYNTSFSFNGTTAWLSIADAANLRFVSGMTIQAWVNPDAVLTTDQVILAKAGSYGLFASSSNPACLGGIRGFFIDATTGVNAICYATPLPAGVWTNVAFTYDNTSLKIYINGILVTSLSNTGTIVQNTNVVAVAQTGTGAEYFKGAIDELHLRNYARNAAEVIVTRDTPINALVAGPSFLRLSALGMRFGAAAAALRLGATP